MTRYLALLLLIATLLLAGCGSRQAPSVPADPAALPATVEPAVVASLLDHPDVLVLDVREPDEYAAGHLPGVTLIPMGEVAARLSEIPTDKSVIVTCRSGNRSGQIVEFLTQQGYTNVHNMRGGILAWEAAGLPVER